MRQVSPLLDKIKKELRCETKFFFYVKKDSLSIKSDCFLLVLKSKNTEEF